ncbi:MAG TPA: thiamine pyrophosphate-dependent dehydrogenase E1 component subunit alpha [bacterium]|nr:thiamine pyrophosphate-dependent dehydrogenase E1 component subunit alpha [bacterium]HOL34732.1 thiamine pyrophosphate-dependent dehydrogenase E1 component subunit alpha [bacterium]HPP08323.1 thiamine pyrophosphate-dependent dehydrogenase E1 component subunit alpha [bacterium]
MKCGYSKEQLLEFYRKMVLIREFEERVKFLFLEGIMPGTIHQYQGEEACAVGVCSALQRGDIITSTHRPHGHCIAMGMDIKSMMAELFGKQTGCCKGKGGSMHMGDIEKGVVPAIAIVGGGIPVATGIAFGFKMKKQPRVAVCFMGDGATNEGTFHESLNMASIWNLPVVYAVENNFYGASTHVSLVMKVEKISERACAYKIPGITVDGNDVIKVYETACEAVERARKGEGPTLIELLTYRITGHSRRDPALYQPPEEKKKALENEPIKKFSEFLISMDITQEELEKIRETVKEEIEDAVKYAMNSPDPLPQDTLNDLFV